MTVLFNRIFLVVIWGYVSAYSQNHPELDWKVFETEHFRVFYHQGLENAALKAGKIAEEAHGPITSLYDYEPKEKVRIVLKDYDDYANGAAFFYHDTIEIWTTSLDHEYELRGTTDWLRNVITHEFTHIVSLGVARSISPRIPGIYFQYFGYQREKNRADILTGYPDIIASYPMMNVVVPMWLAEGAAQYMADGAHHDQWDANRDMILRKQVLSGSQLSFDEMGVFGKCGFGNEYVYDHGYSFVSYIAANYGEDYLGKLFRAAARWHALDIDGVFSKVLGKSIREVYSDWIVELKRQYEKQVEELGELQEGDLVADIGFSNMRPRVSPDGSRLAYLSTQKKQYGPHLLVVRDLQTEDEEIVASGVSASSVSFSSSNDELLFTRIDFADRYGSRQSDIYSYDFAIEDRHWLNRSLRLIPEFVASLAGFTSEPYQEKRLSRGLRAFYPDLSSDGEWIVFVHNSGTNNNLGLIRRDGSELRYLTQFTDGTQIYSPRFSPDGKKIAFSIAREGKRDVAILSVGNDLASADDRIELIVVTDGTDRDPAWSLDGENLYFSSDVSGIFNLYQINIKSREVSQISNVVGGAFNPTVGDSSRIYFSSYDVDGFQIRVIQANTNNIKVSRHDDSELLVREENKEILSLPEADAYRSDFLRTSIMPRVSIDEGRLKPGLYLNSNDVLYKQNVFAGGTLAPANGDRDLFGIYEYRGLRPTLFIEAFHQRRSSSRGDSTDARDGVIDGVRFSLNQLSFGARRKIGRAGELTFSLRYDRYDASVDWRAFVERRDGELGFRLEKQKPFGYTYLKGVGVGATYRLNALARRKDRDISPVGTQLYISYDRMFNRFLETFNEQASFIDEEYLKLNYNQLTIDWNQYFLLPWNMRFGLRIFSGWIDSEEVDDDDLVNDFFDYHLGGLSYMKGYTFYSIEGRKAAMATATLRFPLVSHWGARWQQLYLDKIFAAVYADVGKAWDGARDEPDVFYGRKGPLRDVGGQVRIDLNSHYSLPTRVQFDCAYGIDEVATRSPWKYYLTVLFGYI